MGTQSKTIDVERPVRTVYNQWTQFESFPEFMSGVDSVRQLDDRHVHWEVSFGGVRRAFDAVITAELPDQGIAWESQDGPYQRGVVAFEPLGPDQTRVRLSMDFDPEGFTESVGDALGFVGRQIDEDLERFKKFIESRGVETGSWRGSISDPRAQWQPPGGPPSGFIQ